MKSLKVILYALLGIMTIYFVSNFFFSKEFQVSTSIEIDSSPFIVFDQINNFDNWENWDPWLVKDTTIKVSKSAIPYGLGAFRTWQSKNSGNGKMEIIASDYIKQIDFEITMDESSPFLAIFYLESIGEKVKVSWENKGELPFLARIFGPIMCKMMKGDHEEGLNYLKKYCESIPSKSGEVSIQQWGAMKIISQTDTCSSSNINQSLTKIFSSTFEYLSENDVASTQSPFAQYLSFPQKPGDNDYIILRAGVFVESFGESIKQGQNTSEIPSILSAQAIHKGDYRTIFDTHEKIKTYCQENNYKIVGNPYEIYISKPSPSMDPKDWTTQVIYEIE